MGQYLPGRINIVFRHGVDLKTATESLESAGLLKEGVIAKGVMNFETNPGTDPAQPVRLQAVVDVGHEDDWVARLSVLEEVEICARTMQNIPKAPPGHPQRH